MRRTLIAGLIAATLMPVAAQAQYSPITPRERNEIRRDRQDVREERRDLDRAIRSGDPRAIREERRDLREERRDLRETRYDARTDFGRDDWRAYRNQNRGLYRGGGWRSDYGYQNFRPGARIGGGYYAPRYVIAEPWRSACHAPVSTSGGCATTTT